jgi:multimeric flavodoxin WrbA
MEKILILIGSPRKNGNSVCMSKRLQNKLNPELYALDIQHLYDYRIDACIDCRVCKRGEMVCEINDGMQQLYPKIDTCDVLIFATPIYWFGPTAKTKLLVDRLRPYFGNKKLTGKRGALLLPAGSGPGDCELTVEQFRRTFTSLEIKFLGAVTTTAFNVGDAEKDIYLDSAIQQLVERIEEDE